MSCDNTLDIGNIVLTIGESSPKYEIYSTNPLTEYTAEYRITNEARETIVSKTLPRTAESKNNDSIFGDHLLTKLEGREVEAAPGKVFNHKLEITSSTIKELDESIEIVGLCYDLKMVDTIKKRSELLPEEEEFVIREYEDETTHEIMVVLRREEKVGVPNVEVTITVTSAEKETSRVAKVITNSDGSFSSEIFLGNTTKEEANKGFVFMISSSVTETLKKGRYLVTVTVKKENDLGETVFCREIIQTKLDINDKL